MCPTTSAELTRPLAKWGQGDAGARDALIPLIYDDLRGIARRYLYRERPDHTLQSAALVNEAYLRMMRHILVDHARSRAAAKRGAGAPRPTLNPEMAVTQDHETDLLALDNALKKLGELDADQSRLIEMRFFGGLSIEETALVTGISPATVKREWATGRAWLKREMDEGAHK